MAILFYSQRESPYGCFSNFSAHPFELDGKEWPTSEHYFQAQKFAGTPHEEAVRRASRPMKAAEMGRDRSRPLRRCTIGHNGFAALYTHAHGQGLVEECDVRDNARGAWHIDPHGRAERRGNRE